jgi:hypothetical protein
MESKSYVRVQCNLILSCIGKYFTNLNLSSALFGQCGEGLFAVRIVDPIPLLEIFSLLLHPLLVDDLRELA